MQIAALNPQFICVDDVPAEFVAKEKEILTPVSYTHLDVYKRQILYCIASAIW